MPNKRISELSQELNELKIKLSTNKAIELHYKQKRISSTYIKKLLSKDPNNLLISEAYDLLGKDPEDIPVKILCSALTIRHLLDLEDFFNQ